MKTIKVNNLAEAFELLCEKLVNYPHLVPRAGGGFNFRGDFYLHLYELFIKSRSSRVPGLFLENLGYSSKGAKVSTLISKYIDEEATQKWIDYIVGGANSTPDVPGYALLNTKPQGKRFMPGGCITSFLYRGVPTPALMVFSRSLEMPTKGAADVLLISAVSRLLTDRLGIKDLPVRWLITSTFMRTRNANYYMIYKYPEKVKFANEMFQAYLDKGWKKYYLTDYEFSYASNRRAKQFFLNKKAGRLTSLLDEEYAYKKLEEYLE